MISEIVPIGVLLLGLGTLLLCRRLWKLFEPKDGAE